MDLNHRLRSHVIKNGLLILLSLLLLPLDTLVLLCLYCANLFIPNTLGARGKRSSRPIPRTILITGVGMTKGLALSRMFYKAGHHVIGADLQPNGVPVCGRFSNALRKFYPLPRPNKHDGATRYIQDLVGVIRKENVDLWVSCSGVASAVEDGQAKQIIERTTECVAIQFDAATTATLHEKDTFMERVAQLGLPMPETYNVTSRGAVHRVLHASPKKRYIMKSAGMDDAARGDMTILPRRTPSQTYTHLAKIPISPSKAWVLQEYVKGKEYCTHALIIRGRVKAFVACPSLELLMHYEALPPDCALSQAMLQFTREFAARSNGNMTGHLSFDFLVDEVPTEKGVEAVLRPIECNPRAHTAVALFDGQSKEMSEAYLDALSRDMNGSTHEHSHDIVTPKNPAKYYWIGHDLVTMTLMPLPDVLLGKMRLSAYFRQTAHFVEHVLLWKDGTLEVWDPLPWWWLYHIYWPGQFLAAMLRGQKWSRVNVSTVKMFLR